MADRIATIQKMLQNSPDDVFLHYSLAMEFAATGQIDQAVTAFGRCVELDANYLPAYVEGGKCLRSGGRLPEARAMFQQGLALASNLGNKHMQDFIQQQLEGLGQ